jgi:murein DD-endopeptidase MepM/ murein hydrolase activator NlpD
MVPRRSILVLALVALVALGPTLAAPASAAGIWPWPVSGPVLRPFDPPLSPYGSGHRGIDIAAPIGTPVLAPAPGTVTFAGKVGGHLFMTLDHGAGLESTYSWLSSVAVRRGDVVGTGAVIATTGHGHVAEPWSHLHLGVKLSDVYVDPLNYLGVMSVSDYIRLAP